MLRQPPSAATLVCNAVQCQLVNGGLRRPPQGGGGTVDLPQTHAPPASQHRSRADGMAASGRRTTFPQHTCCLWPGLRRCLRCLSMTFKEAWMMSPCHPVGRHCPTIDIFAAFRQGLSLLHLCLPFCHSIPIREVPPLPFPTASHGCKGRVCSNNSSRYLDALKFGSTAKGLPKCDLNNYGIAEF